MQMCANSKLCIMQMHEMNTKTHEMGSVLLSYCHMSSRDSCYESAVAKMAATPVEIENIRTVSKR